MVVVIFMVGEFATVSQFNAGWWWWGGGGGLCSLCADFNIFVLCFCGFFHSKLKVKEKCQWINV